MARPWPGSGDFSPWKFYCSAARAPRTNAPRKLLRLIYRCEILCRKRWSTSDRPRFSLTSRSFAKPINGDLTHTHTHTHTHSLSLLLAETRTKKTKRKNWNTSFWFDQKETKAGDEFRLPRVLRFNVKVKITSVGRRRQRRAWFPLYNRQSVSAAIEKRAGSHSPPGPPRQLELPIVTAN